MTEIIFDEQSSGVVTYAFTDENGNDVIPNAVLWTLTTADRETVINEREQVEVEALASVKSSFRAMISSFWRRRLAGNTWCIN